LVADYAKTKGKLLESKLAMTLDTDGTGVMATSHVAEQALAGDAVRAFKSSQAHDDLKLENILDEYFKTRPGARLTPKNVRALHNAAKWRIGFADSVQRTQAITPHKDSGSDSVASRSSIEFSGGALEGLSVENIVAWINQAQLNAWKQRVGAPHRRDMEATATSPRTGADRR
jgi:hypothetical protein